MNDKEFATLAARAALAGIAITRQDDGFNAKRGESTFSITTSGDTQCAPLEDGHDILQDGVQGKTKIAPQFVMHIANDANVTKMGDRCRLAKEVRVIVQDEMRGVAVVEIRLGTSVD